MESVKIGNTEINVDEAIKMSRQKFIEVMGMHLEDAGAVHDDLITNYELQITKADVGKPKTHDGKKGKH